MSWTWSLDFEACAVCGEYPTVNYPLYPESGCQDDAIQVTYNFSAMHGRAGVYEALRDTGATAGEVVKVLEAGLAHVRANPHIYDELARANGDWGTRKQFEMQLAEMAARCRRYPKTKIRASD